MTGEVFKILFGFLIVLLVRESAGQTPSPGAEPTPRGSRRILYVSDPSSIALNLFPDPVQADDLRRWVDMLADHRVDTFNQEVYSMCWSVYWRSERVEYDQRPQHKRFLPMLDAGVQPLDVLIDQSHKRRMSFIPGFRVNDNHGGVGKFIKAHSEWVLSAFPDYPYYKLSKPLDFSYDGVREFFLSVVAEVVERFDVDGIELCFRDHGYFPVNHGRENAHLMTDLVRKVRNKLDAKGKALNKKLLLGVRVFSTLDECRFLGLDVPAWIDEGLIDYLSPQDVMYADFGAPYAEFAKLTRASKCLLYPAQLPWTSVRARNRLGQAPLSLAQCRALAQTFYGAGADGISIYNHFVTMWHAPFYPQALRIFRQLREPKQVAAGERHYVFDPTWGGHEGFGMDRCSTGAIKAQRIVLDRNKPNASGEFRFPLYEDLARSHGASLLFRGFQLTSDDELEVTLNGKVVPSSAIGRTKASGTPPVPWLQTVEGQTRRVLSEQGRIDFRPAREPSSSTRWFSLTAPFVAVGENVLAVRLTKSDPKASSAVVIDELEVFVQP